MHELCNNMDFEMRKYFVGPMPVEAFLDNFLPAQGSTAKRDELPEFGVMAGFTLESQMYDAFVRSSLIALLDLCF